jgi:cytochrome b
MAVMVSQYEVNSNTGVSVYPHQSLNRVRVWDLPTRLFHWTLVACVTGLAISGLIGGGALTWHFRFGYGVIALLAFRIIWGLVGGRWSRFGAFIYAPQSIVNYIKGKGKPEHSVGHTPLGAASVFALLVFLVAQASTGLMSDDEVANSGPLTHLVSNAAVQLATFYHAAVGKWVLLVLVGLHIGAIIFYQRRQHKLGDAMVHGDKTLALAVPSSRDDGLTRTAALMIFALCGAGAYWVSTLAAPTSF